jgi:regulatory protein
LRDYLTRKLRERGWAGDAPADPGAVAERMATLGYLDDRAYGEMKAAAMARRGLGRRRVDQALRHAGLEEEDRDALDETIDAGAWDSALAFARRRRLGPFAAAALGPRERERAIAAMLRAGHGFDIARRILGMAPGEAPEPGPDLEQF